MRHLLLLTLILLSLVSPARADDISTAGRGVTRIVVYVELSDGRAWATLGTGFAVASGQLSTTNRVITNNHVIQIVETVARYAQENGYDYSAYLFVVPSLGSQSYAARILRTNPTKDLALLEISDGSLPSLRLFGGSPVAGEAITALGYPGNVDQATARSYRDYLLPTSYTRTSGEYSAMRPVNGINAYLHSAQIAHGHSGGPMVDRCGRVLGVNTVITRADDGDATYAFAVSNHELLTFLGEAGMSPQQDSGTCVTTEELAQQEQARRQLAATQARDACNNRNQATRERFDRATRDEEAEARRASDLKLFLALGLLVCTGLAAGAAGMLISQKKKKPAIAAGSIGGALLLGAIILFALRDAGREPPQPNPAENCEAAANSAVANMTSGNASNAM